MEKTNEVKTISVEEAQEYVKQHIDKAVDFILHIERGEGRHWGSREIRITMRCEARDTRRVIDWFLIENTEEE